MGVRPVLNGGRAEPAAKKKPSRTARKGWVRRSRLDRADARHPLRPDLLRSGRVIREGEANCTVMAES
ncbi:hypothetical protein GCM10010994_05810 [Chelatococcus reniformis]|uniref:Uncharacterized protein n=1 Tax=Chelatococcus reniformis TaxID=1494448 RepID=A0A916TY54_9HYPH|nr:hypothetical protein GCM10010994_05810 [Chelatococcus reniformis]